ncbi:4Fe-4S binding protein [Entomospira nematocerorum]|uniref:4Fe-4S binding protein n=1 Tax=Entomospira nematocerorum TaxID=2719987 RepID=A0A968GGN4_9SPIO|nr:4Fe-4S binding protein [Entomospira nematocera]NIZ46791.1 4Fe-4S binding protein [Entomospira nematocera]WDI33412.1 4Fe-4S binding protein [Entomospira nematocera]
MNTSTLPISKRWHQHLWIISILYFSLGLFNILFAWLGLICVAIPITTAMIKNDKSFCYLYCPRSKMLNLLGHRLKLSRYKAPPALFSYPWFRKGFMFLFFGSAFTLYCTTFIHIRGQSTQAILLSLWEFHLPWTVRSIYTIPSPLALFALSSYSAMLLSMILSIIMMILYKPRSWCTCCPMGTLTQSICMDNVKEQLKR